MHQPVLMHPHVDERPEIGDIGDRALEDHPRREVGDLGDVLAPLRRCKLLARIAARLAQLLPDVLQRIKTDLLSLKALDANFLQQIRTGDQVFDLCA